MSDVDIAHMMTAIEAGPMLQQHKANVIASLNTKLISAPVAVLGHRTTPTSCENIRFYFTAEEWQQWSADLGDCSICQQVLEMVVKRAIELGHTNPTEKSFGAIATIAANFFVEPVDAAAATVYGEASQDHDEEHDGKAC